MRGAAASPKKRQGIKHAGGRPPKFHEPRRAVTMTLPERTLLQLAAVDRDRARAIVKLTNAAVCEDLPPGKLVEVVEIEPGTGVILVGPSSYLRRIPWLKLVEITPARYLLVIPTGTPIDSLEVALRDILDELPATEQRERAILEELESRMRQLRRVKKVSKAELLFIDTTVRLDEAPVPDAAARSRSRSPVWPARGTSRG
jgi:hypothetical protein